jgi:crotonobetaine/carnitine-CoA ligase
MTGAGAGFIRPFVETAETEPERVYARFEGAPVTFGWLHLASAAVAARLRAQGLLPGDRVAVMLNNAPETIALLLGLAKAGLVWVPVNVALRGDNLRYLLDHAEPSLAFVDAAFLPQVAASGARLPERSVVPAGPPHGLAAWLEGPGLAEPLPEPSALFAIMYTSGTTGRPKGVLVTHRMLRLAGESAALVSAARDGDVFFAWEPLFHIGGAQLLVVPLLRRVVLAMVARFSAGRFWQQVKAEGATHIHFLGGILQILLKQPPGPLDQTHGARIAWGGGCPPDDWRPFEDRFGMQIRECYGMTEASSMTTFNDGGPVGSVGKPMPWFSIDLLDEQGRPVRPGERGEIVVRSHLQGALTDGYFKNPEATQALLQGGALHSGDVGSVDAGGNLYFHGRKSDSVRCRGENVSAFEVEHVAAAHPAVEDCAMIGVAADVGEQEIKLFLKPKPGSTISLPALSDWLAERLAPFQNPRYLSIVDEFERTPSLRIVKHRLPKEIAGSFDRLAQ